MSGNPADSLIYLADLRVARLTVVSSLTIPGGGDGGAVDELVNADASGARVFKTTAGGTATLRRLASATNSLTIDEEDEDEVITFTLARAVIGSGAEAVSTSVALGPGADASGETSVALGSGADASGPNTAALGPSATVSGLGCSTAVGAGAAARVAGTINFGGIPIVRKVGDTPITGHTPTTIRAAPLVALTTGTWDASATGDVASLVIPSGTVFFPETLRVWCEAVYNTSSSDLTLSAGMTIGGTRVNFVDAMPIGLINAPWASRVGAIATTKGLTAGTIYFTQGTTGGATAGNYTLRCSIQGFLIETS
jgi:hypothetical protein